ncbi:hypothetical protein JTG28_004166 [Escherichia coli]|nr:hypothetical protein [Escherichia coli]
MAKFIIIKVMRGTFPNDEKAYGPFAGKPGAIFHVETDEGKAKYIPVASRHSKWHTWMSRTGLKRLFACH